METMMVIASIWAMVALCAVLLVRGATMPGRERRSAGHALSNSELIGETDAAMRRAD
jgi:hypothetical protein